MSRFWLSVTHSTGSILSVSGGANTRLLPREAESMGAACGTVQSLFTNFDLEIFPLIFVHPLLGFAPVNQPSLERNLNVFLGFTIHLVTLKIKKIEVIELWQLASLKTFWCTLLKSGNRPRNMGCIPEYLYVIDTERCNIISPYIYSKNTTGASQTCPKCRIGPGTRLHCSA